MMTPMIQLSGNKVTVLTNKPRNIGAKIAVKVRLPNGSLLQSLTLRGAVIRCQPVTVGHDESPRYVVEVTFGDLSPVNRRILEAYIDFVERRNMLKEIKKVDFKALEDVMRDFGERLAQLSKTSELLRDNVKGTLELLIRHGREETTIH